MSDISENLHDSRFIIGIDLGTTNIAAFYIDTEVEPRQIQHFRIPQVIAPGEVDGCPMLPSFCYLPAENEGVVDGLSLPWSDDAGLTVGTYAREHGARVPGRLIASAKSWLAHHGVDRQKPILPWGSDAVTRKMSPVAVTARYITHLKNAWNHRFRRTRDADGSPCTFEDQQVIITIPASFDETARELTIQAAKQAGLREISLVEEPLSAFYSWLDVHQDTWQEQVEPEHSILVIDVGGGTTDFSLVRMNNDHVLHRYAVGDHVLLGGDNIDMTIARHIEEEWGARLDGGEWASLCQLCRAAKEELLSTEKTESAVTLMTAGSSVIGNMKHALLTREKLYAILENGFYPTPAHDADIDLRGAGIRKMGLPYAANPSVSDHLLGFLRYAHRVSCTDTTPTDSKTPVYPHFVLFNGGSMAPDWVRGRILQTLSSWFPDRPPPLELTGADMSLAVARGAAYFGWVRRGRGVKVRGGIARSYYVEARAKTNANQLLCVMARDTDENVRIDVPGNFLVDTNVPVKFTLYSSATRLRDRPGEVIENSEEFTRVAPLATALQFGKSGRRSIAVSIRTQLTEVGTLQIFVDSAATAHTWPLQFDLRPLASPTLPAQQRRAAPTVDLAKSESAHTLLRDTFSTNSEALAAISKHLEATVGVDRHDWPVPLIRGLWEILHALKGDRLKSPAHEMRWFNLAGYCLRPGIGDPGDSLRMREMWKMWFDGIRHNRNAQVVAEWWVMWRRIAAGLKPGHQNTVANTLRKLLIPKGVYRKKIKEGDQAKREMWRCLGALEAIPVKAKTAVGSALINHTSALESYEYWVVSRLASRRLFHAPADLIVPPATAEKWIRGFMATESSQKEGTMRLFAISRMVSRTGDRALDLPEAAYQDVLAFLQQQGCPQQWMTAAAGDAAETREDMEKLLADTLPEGLRLAG